ncbi:hypothetical protein DFH08DRAFT_139479 [Mycena albidolilacea]|uniref:Uncharacterized protein n=1 Tax=Mycena albidolilacea TaxID=1033008 RepID=A0AAD7A585_9AGAR|nr:hypothetical protein DFH08DRAFT_139479 [Mycena albidolilacea]
MAPNRNKKKKICHCTPDYNQWRSCRTQQRHYQNAPDPGLIAPSDSGSSSSDSEDELDPELPSAAPPQHPSQSPDFVPDTPNSHQSTPDNDPMDINNAMDIDNASDSDSDSASDSGTAGNPGHFNFLAPAEDEEFEIDGWSGFDEVLDADGPVGSREEMLTQLEEMVAPGRDAELWAVRNDILTDQDCDNIRAFHFKMISNMSREVFEQLRFAFNHKLGLSSEYVILHRVAVLSHVEPMWIHCCVNSCMAYTDDDAELHACRFCKEPRFTPIPHKPHRFFFAIFLLSPASRVTSRTVFW